MKAKIIARINNSEKGDLVKAIPLRTPYSVHIDICNLCNFKCKFCFQADREAVKRIPQGYMAFDLFKKIADEIILFEDNIRKVKIGLHGEPTLHPKLPQMIAYLKLHNSVEVIELFTNGSRLNALLNKKLITAGLDRINISVEALDAKGYLSVAGVKMDMKVFLHNIKNLYEQRGNCKIYIKIAGTKDKQKFYDMFGNICDEIYCENIVPQYPQVKRNELNGVGMYGQKIPKYKKVCPFIFMYLHINWDGIVSPCTLDWARQVVIGDANRESLVNIWMGTRLKNLQLYQLWGKRRKIPFCKDCLAPMVCVQDNLDNDAETLLRRIR